MKLRINDPAMQEYFEIPSSLQDEECDNLYRNHFERNPDGTLVYVNGLGEVLGHARYSEDRGGWMIDHRNLIGDWVSGDLASARYDLIEIQEGAIMPESHWYWRHHERRPVHDF